MILYIKGANFSASNIGTLSTYIVQKTMGAGISHNIPNFINRNEENVVWTVTLSQDYIFGEYSIVMGGEVIEPNIQDNIMTITIPVVTNNISISIASIYENNGDGSDGQETVILLNNNVNFSDLSVSSYGPTQGTGGSSFVERCALSGGTYVDYVDFYVITPNKTFPSEPITIPYIKLYFVDAETETVEELVYDQANQSSILSDTTETNGYQIIRCPIKRTLQKNIHLGITVNEGYSDYSSLYTIPYVNYTTSNSILGKPYFGTTIVLGQTVAGKTANYYCPMVIYGY